jgi:cytochrome P450
MKGNYIKGFFLILLILLILLVLFSDTDRLRVNIIVFLTLKRGIISQNCFWWKINDSFPDSTGSEIYQNLKKESRFVQLNIFGQKMYLLTELRDIQELLDLSPNPFGPGKFKKNFFASFIPQNVGIAVNPEWKYKREYNDEVLQTDRSHIYNQMFSDSIRDVLMTLQPTNFEEFTECTRRITSKIIFGTYDYNPILYKVFKQADSLLSARFGLNTVNPEDLEEYRKYLRKELESPKPNTLMFLANKYHPMLPTDQVIDQIPHWVFPIAGLFSVHLPRLLVLLVNHPEELERVILEIQEETISQTKESYIRKCILELFRLNNAVNSTFRGLTEPFQFKDSNIQFEAGTEFVFFNNPVLRDLFEYPNQFVPVRWNRELEESYRALMFNQANQKCPGKEMVISLLTMGLTHYLQIRNFKIQTNITIDPNFVPYILNPCTIKFD